MPRPREFDTDRVLNTAMNLFWAKGYAHTSLHDLTRAMGLSKSSFYEAFGSKHALFLAAIDRYVDRVAARAAAELASDRPAREAIAASFSAIIDAAVEAGDRRGCLLGNTALEMTPHDADAAKHIRAGLRRLEQGYYMAVLRGQVAGDIPDDRPARALARFLASLAQGLQLMARVRPERIALEDIAHLGLAALDRGAGRGAPGTIPRADPPDSNSRDTDSPGFESPDSDFPRLDSPGSVR